ncbi:hypothetical protein [Nocardia abscessus]|uniref:hypothetical protein n=1 Tax=Nocardia abscessus TaxID=120957 RepID=UPI003CC7CA5B
MRADRVLRRRAPVWEPGTTGRPQRHGGGFVFGYPATWDEPDTAVTTDTRLYGLAIARSWNHMHPKFTHRSTWPTKPGAARDRRHGDPCSTWTGYPAARCRNRCDRRIRLSISTPPRSLSCGRRICGGSISSTPSAC